MHKRKCLLSKYPPHKKLIKSTHIHTNFEFKARFVEIFTRTGSVMTHHAIVFEGGWEQLLQPTKFLETFPTLFTYILSTI